MTLAPHAPREGSANVDRFHQMVTLVGELLYRGRYWLVYFGVIALAIWGCYRLLKTVGALD